MLTKILSIATLILSIVYFGVTATLFSYRVNYKALFEKEQKAHKETAKNLEEQIKELEKKIGDIQNLYTASEFEKQMFKEKYETVNDLLKKNKEDYSLLNKSHAKLMEEFTSLQGELKRLQEDNKNLQQTIQTEKSEREKFEMLYAQELEKNLALSERQGQIEQENAELSKMLVDKTKENEELKEKIQKVKELEIPIPEIAIKKKAIDGIVTAVSNKVNLILISVGQEAGVEIGDQFTVYRRDNYIGKVIIEKVWKDGAAGRSIKDLEKEKIQQGDRVTTRIF
ncbi:MAG: hypothetical protein ACK4NF_07005 [Planctomycetota bacterium]